MIRSSFRVAVVLLLPVAAAGHVRAEEEKPKVVPLAEAAKHVDQTVTVELTVQSSRLLAGRNICFLNSERDFRDAKNFTVVILREGLEKFKAANIADPAAHYQGKKIRVTGKVSLRDEKPQIRLEEPKQIEPVKEERKKG